MPLRVHHPVILTAVAGLALVVISCATGEELSDIPNHASGKGGGGGGFENLTGSSGSVASGAGGGEVSAEPASSAGAVSGPSGFIKRGTGTLAGRIAAEPSGSEGFGFDPIFIPDGEEQTVADLGNDWKREYSHRANAARALLMALGESG